MKNPLLIIAGLLTAAAGNSYASGDGTKILKNTNSLKACIQYARQEMNKIGIQVEENPQKESGYPDFYLTSQQQTVGEGSYQNGTCNIELYE